MPTRLPGTDVVIVGLGAAGGVAALPLAESGLSVVGLEAGSRLTRKDFAPDELRIFFISSGSNHETIMRVPIIHSLSVPIIKFSADQL